MRWWFLVGVAIGSAIGAGLAMAQSLTQAPRTVGGYFVVATCGTLVPALKAGTYAAGTIDVNGQFCTSK